MQVEQIDRELFIDILNPDSSTAESVRQGRSYTWEVEQLARHRHQARAEVVGEIVAMLDERISVYQQKRDKADPLADETFNRHTALTYVIEALEIVEESLGDAK